MIKKLFSLLTALLFVGSLWAGDVQVGQFASDGMDIGTNYKSYSNDDWTLSVGGGGDNASCGYNNNDNNKKTIGNAYGTAANVSHYGYTIVGKTLIENAYKMTFIYTGGNTYTNGILYLGYSTDGENWNAVSLKSGTGLSGQGANVGSTNTTYTFEFDAAIASAYYAIIVSKNTTSSSGQFRYDHVTATFFELEEDAVATPSIASSNEKSYFQGNVTITLGCTTEGASIYYTLDGTAPSSSSTPYSSAFTLDATTTVKAIAIKELDESEIASQTFTLCPTEMTCAEAKTAALTVSGNNVPYADGLTFTVQGYVTDAGTWADSKVTFWMDDAYGSTKTLQAYNATCTNEEDAPSVGDVVRVTGTLTKYGSTPEFAAGCTFTIIPQPYVSPDPTSLDFGTVEQNASVTAKTFTLTGSNLTDANAVSISAPAGYTVSPTSVNPSSGSISATITVTPITTTADNFDGDITISSDDLDDDVTVALTMTVVAPVAVTGVTLNKNELELEENETETLVATVAPNNATNKAVTWESDDTDVATVDANGLVTAKAPGTANITCTSVADNTKAATCEVTVTEHIVTPGEYDIILNNAFFGTSFSGSINGDAKGNFSGSQNDITIQYNLGTGSNQYINDSQIRLYNGTALVISAPNGYAITSVEGLATTVKTTVENQGTISSGTWTGSANPISFTHNSTTGNSVLTTISVTFAAGWPTSVDNTEISNKAVKFIQNGQLFIELNGHIYNVQGQTVK